MLGQMMQRDLSIIEILKFDMLLMFGIIKRKEEEKRNPPPPAPLVAEAAAAKGPAAIKLSREEHRRLVLESAENLKQMEEDKWGGPKLPPMPVVDPAEVRVCLCV